jgi:hypothetical protein
MTMMIRAILPAAALLISLSACAADPTCTCVPPQGVQTSTIPGWTGRTVVPGSNSTIAGDAVATEQQQKWQIERGR